MINQNQYDKITLCAYVEQGRVKYFKEYSLNGRIVGTEYIPYPEFVRLLNQFEKYCDNREIFYIEDRDGYYWINGADGYKKSEWTIEEAVKDYKSAEGKARRFDSEYRAWCD